MTKPHSTRSDSQSKPAKPYPDFPLTPHPTGRWCKKILGRLHYFGPLADPDGALAKYLEQKQRLHAGLTTSDNHEVLTVYRLCAKFLATKKVMRDAGELSVHSWADYARVCNRLVKAFGKGRQVADLRPEDFERLRTKMAASYGPVRLGNEINRTRVVFNYAFKNGLIDKPMVYGEGFRRPSRKTLRSTVLSKGPRCFRRTRSRRCSWRPGSPSGR